MSRKLIVGISLIAATNAMWFLSAQEFNTTVKKPQYSNADQPAKSTAPPTRAKPPLDRPPRLTDPATDENGNPLLPTKLEPATGSTTPATIRLANPDRVLAAWVGLDNEEEMALAQLGSTRATHPDVKQFAKMLVDDHAALENSLKTFAPEITATGFLNTTAKDARDQDIAVTKQEIIAKQEIETPTPPPPGNPGSVNTIVENVRPKISAKLPPEPRAEPAVTRTEAAINRDFSVEQIARELAVQRLASSRKMLTERRGSEFDRFFMVQQVVMHKAMRDKLIVYQRHVSAPLAEVLANAEHACDEHMMKALELIKRLPATTEVSSTPAKAGQKVAVER